MVGRNKKGVETAYKPRIGVDTWLEVLQGPDKASLRALTLLQIFNSGGTQKIRQLLENLRFEKFCGGVENFGGIIVQK